MAVTSADKLVIRGAREHNLKNISLELPRDRLIVITGLSGSGKSSLAFDTIYAEGQRRYVESLSSYARQFLGQMDKPDVDFIEGLSPAISIDQKSASRNPRSTVGTITEVYDYLRLLYARIGLPHCPEPWRAASPARRRSRSSTGSCSCPRAPASRCWPRSCGAARAPTRPLFADLAAQGFARAIVDGELHELTDEIELARYEQHTIEVDRRPAGEPARHRAPAHRLARDRAPAGRRRGRGPDRSPRRRRRGRPRGAAHVQPAPGLPGRRRVLRGAGPAELLVQLALRRLPALRRARHPLRGRSRAGRARPRRVGRRTAPSPRGRATGRRTSPGWSRRCARSTTSTANAPFGKLPARHKKLLLYGAGNRVNVSYRNRYGRTRSYHATYEGVVPWLERRYQDSESDSAREQIEGYMREVPCPECDGARLKPLSLAVTVDGRNIAELCMLSIGESAKVLAGPRPVRARPDDRRAGGQGGQRPHGLPPRRRPRLPDAVALGRHPGRRRGPAHPAGRRRSAAVWSACCTCSTSRRSASTSATTIG